MSGVKKNVLSAVLKLSKDGELRTEHSNRFLRRRMHIHRTLSSSTELQGHRKQTTEFDLPHRNLHRALINMQGPVHTSLCNHQTQFELDALCHGSQCSRSRSKPMMCEYFPALQSFLAAAFITCCRRSRA